MPTLLEELADAIGIWLSRHRLDKDTVRVVLSFDNRQDMHEAERAIKADEMWRAGWHRYYDEAWLRGQFKVCGVDIRLENRKDR